MRSVFVRTARICCIVTFATVICAYAIAYVWVRGGRTQRVLTEFCILVPFWVSVLTRAFGWVAMLSNRGLLNTWLQASGLVTEPLPLVRNELGVVIGMTHFLIPFAVFPIAASMRALDERVLLAARGLGARRLRLFWTVFLPMTRSGIIGAALVVFVFSLGFFVTPAILGGGRSVMVAELVYLTHVRKPGLGDGRRVERRAGRHRGAADRRAVPLHPARPRRRIEVRSYRPGPLGATLGLSVAAFLLLPLLAVVPVSFTPARYLSMPGAVWSWRHYRDLLDDPDWLAAILLSLRVAMLSSAIATTLATGFALGLWLLRPRAAAALVGFVLLPMVVPPVISAVALYFLLTAMSGLNLWVGYDTWLGVVLAHVVVIAPFAVVLVLTALAQVDRRIDLAARGMGASVATRAWRVILPNIRFAIGAAALLCFVLSWDEIGVTLFITSVNAVTLPRLIWMGLRDNIDPAIAAISVLLIALTAIVLAARIALRRQPDPQ